MDFPLPVGVLPVYASYYTRGSYGRKVEVLQGVCYIKADGVYYIP